MGPVWIGPREIYDKVVLLEATLSRVDARLVDHVADVQDHEQRIRGLERSRWPLPAVALLFSAAALVLPLVVR